MYTKDKNKSINIRINNDDYDKLTELAKLFDMTTSQYIRQIIEQNLIANKIAKSFVDNTTKEELDILLKGASYANK